MLKTELLVTLTIYPFVLILGWFFCSWRVRVEKLLMMEKFRYKSNIFRFSSTRIAALYLWGFFELGSTVYLGFKYNNEPFQPIA